LRYEYRLSETSWTPAPQRSLSFANLAPGQYEFEVRAINDDRMYSKPATVIFSIAAPLWQRWWFISALLVLVAFTIYVFFRYRLTQLLELERMRTRIATDLHDDIGSNLTKISILSEIVKQRSNQDDKGNFLTSIADISRESVSAMSDIVWSINPGKDSLLELTRRMRQYAEDLCQQSSLQLNFNSFESSSDLKLNADIRRNVYMIFKESLNNIVRHSKASEVWVDFGNKDHQLILLVRDDGAGFEGSLMGDGGNGLVNMQKRAAALKGEFDITSNPNEGTKIVLAVPLERPFWK
jgi:signal transduction histidine kinase